MNINSDIPIPQEVIDSHTHTLLNYYEYHLQENTSPPYQFYYKGHLVSITISYEEYERLTSSIIQKERIISLLTICICVGIIGYAIFFW